MTVTTTKAFELYHEFNVSETADAQILELAEYAIKEGCTTEESLLPIITYFVKSTFDIKHRLLIEKFTADVMYEIDALVA
jgi:hypothetical protein